LKVWAQVSGFHVVQWAKQGTGDLRALER